MREQRVDMAGVPDRGGGGTSADALQGGFLCVGGEGGGGERGRGGT